MNSIVDCDGSIIGHTLANSICQDSKSINVLYDKSVFNQFKLCCFNAWKFKNVLLNSEEFLPCNQFLINNTEENYQATWDILNSIKTDMLAHMNDESTIQVYYQLYKIAKLILYESIIKRNMKANKEKAELCKKGIGSMMAEKAINLRKIEILEEVKSKILRSHAVNTSLKNTIDSKEASFSKLKLYFKEILKTLQALRLLQQTQEVVIYNFLDQIIQSVVQLETLLSNK